MGDARFNRVRRRYGPPHVVREISADDIPGIGHNGGPPLEHVPEWGPGGIGTYFSWRAACESAYRSMPKETAIRRAIKAESLGLTFEEYQLEILERGRFLQAEDTVRIAEIIARRRG
jgi:hypothetical protein